MKICPKCNKEYSSRPALSRDPAYIDICPACGVREALEMAGIMETDPTYMAVITAVEEGERAASAAGKKKRGRGREGCPRMKGRKPKSMRQVTDGPLRILKRPIKGGTALCAIRRKA